MDITNITQLGSLASFATGATKVAGSGHALPELGQVHVRSNGGQGVNPVHQQNNPASSSQPQPNSDELSALVDHANHIVQSRFSDLKFTVAEGTDINVVRIEDAKTGELIRQVPSETMVAIAQALDRAQRGTMLEEQA